MENKEIIQLIEKFNSKTIQNHELERLKQLVTTYEGKKNFVHFSNVEIEKNILQNNNSAKYDNFSNVRTRFLHSISTNKKVSKKLTLNPYLLVSASIAAALVLIFSTFIFFNKENAELFQWSTISTVHGEQKSIKLPDNSIINLNGNSTLSYSISPKQNMRLIKLKGEAFFDVKKDINKPFLVITKDFTTKVVGTSFNVDSDIDKSIAVSSGKVEVIKIDENKYAKNIAYKLKDLENDSLPSLLLSIGQKGTLTNDKWHLDKNTVTNWHQKELTYINESVKNILKKAYRYYGDSVTTSPKLLNAKVSISFKDKNVEQVLKTLAEINNAKLIKKSDKLWEIK